MTGDVSKTERSAAFWEGLKALSADTRAAREANPPPAHLFDTPAPLQPATPSPTIRFVSEEPKA
jgi:hypothetical protein